ncbi:uncharacterized protein HMPREF1541_06989 [Cyphellophora europaea CBS 101466]|uniref:Uncharacterized protein n=1 Tax=Cyphellophora europaea (strain CBS 101466) TaxID=1220924 RepID=W2RR77_CYPE1|nr:uncharacterized protein HMPREF1541_06989 [Cyphellophora europaea CBS 101466]ETN38947.1 hypothetical protein HMPREF1541_06989 [Cyphellophora europaea CBS 101466]
MRLSERTANGAFTRVNTNYGNADQQLIGSDVPGAGLSSSTHIARVFHHAPVTSRPLPRVGSTHHVCHTKQAPHGHVTADYSRGIHNPEPQPQPATTQLGLTWRESTMNNQAHVDRHLMMLNNLQPRLNVPSNPNYHHFDEGSLDYRRRFEAEEPDPEDPANLKWESWALRKLIKQKLGVDDEQIKVFLSHEWQDAQERKIKREGLAELELKQVWQAHLARNYGPSANQQPRQQFAQFGDYSGRQR